MEDEKKRPKFWGLVQMAMTARLEKTEDYDTSPDALKEEPPSWLVVSGCRVWCDKRLELFERKLSKIGGLSPALRERLVAEYADLCDEVVKLAGTRLRPEGVDPRERERVEIQEQMLRTRIESLATDEGITFVEVDLDTFNRPKHGGGTYYLVQDLCDLYGPDGVSYDPTRHGPNQPKKLREALKRKSGFEAVRVGKSGDTIKLLDGIRLRRKRN